MAATENIYKQNDKCLSNTYFPGNLTYIDNVSDIVISKLKIDISLDLHI